jgi:hypothetical protein
MNSRYSFVLFEEQALLDQDIILNKRHLLDELITFLILANTNLRVDLEGIEDNK